MRAFESSWLLTVLCLSLCFAAACGDDKKPRPDGGSEDGGTDGGDMDAGRCTQFEQSDLEMVAFDGQDDVSIGYSAKLKPAYAMELVPEYFVLSFINQASRIDNPTGTFPLDDEENGNLGTCAECLSLFVDEPSAEITPTAVLFQTAGTITLRKDPRTRMLDATITGLRLEEVSVNQETLESSVVPGGRCVEFGTLTFDLKVIPEEWTCTDTKFAGDGLCDCNCGAYDPDCDDGDNTVIGCAGNEICYYGECRAKCDALSNVPVGCTTGICVVDVPDDLCNDAPDIADPAALGGLCTVDTAYVCNVENTIALGLCDNTEDRTCRPLCASRADCNDGEFCYTIAGGYIDGMGKGYCMPGIPPGWLCDEAEYDDGVTCNCDCGDVDPDCSINDAPVVGCTGEETCQPDSSCG